MGLVKIETESMSPLKIFNQLLIGEVFRYRNSPYLKISINTAFKFDGMYCIGFNDLESVVPVNSKLVVEE